MEITKLTQNKFVWRVLEPILLGSIANLLVNIAFNPLHFNRWWSLSEFVVAILLCAFITEINRLLEHKIENYYSWTLEPAKRFLCNLFFLTLSVAFVVNVLGNLYVLAIGDSFYTLGEMVTINLMTFLVAFLLTIFRWTTHFFTKWKGAEVVLNESNTRFNSLIAELNEENEMITLTKSNKDYILNIIDVRIALLEFGVVKAYMSKGDFYVFHGSLSRLASLLPERLFFPVTRNMIVHKKAIHSISSASYGKVELQIIGVSSKSMTVHVSRLKAASFRKWYNSSSAPNS